MRMTGRLVLLVSCTAVSTLAHAWATPRDAIERFMRFELEGGRLEGNSLAMSRRREFMRISPGDDAPGWDRVELVHAYTVERVECASDTHCTATVRFVFDGSLILDVSVVPHIDGETGVATYGIVNDDGRWFVTPPDGPPRLFSPVHRNRTPPARRVPDASGD